MKRIRRISAVLALTMVLPLGLSACAVATQTVTDHDGVKQYEFAANQTQSKKFAEKVGTPMYGVGIVNKGESFVYENGQWTD